MICLLFLFVLYNYAAMFVDFHHANVFIYNNKLQLFFFINTCILQCLLVLLVLWRQNDGCSIDKHW